jgi:DNA-binding response OmpR family regulator
VNANPVAILVIEDNKALGEMVKRRLSQLGYAVFIADNGAQGWELLKTMTPSIILLDIHLPDKSGWEVAAELKANADTAQIPIIAVTAHAMSGDRQRAIGAGCNDYTTKPIDFHALNEKIKYLIN